MAKEKDTVEMLMAFTMLLLTVGALIFLFVFCYYEAQELELKRISVERGCCLYPGGD